GYSFRLFDNIANTKLIHAIENEDTAEITRVLKSDTTFDINTREKKFGQTLLSLAAGTDKPASVLSLLKNGANPNICDSFGQTALSSVCEVVSSREKAFEIIEALLKFGANPNWQPCDSTIQNTRKNIPLEEAISNFRCSKLLIENGADYNFNDSSGYPVWFSMLALDGKISESIFLAEYLLIEKKVRYPKIVWYSKPDKSPIYFDKLLLSYNTAGDPEKAKAKNNIIRYLALE
ncbi:MAG: ankyrin repeat domain-containing protein, partial [Bacteroidetes bacterium]